MKCNICQEELYQLFDLDVEQRLSDDVQAHLLECTECTAEYRKMQEVMVELRPKVHPVVNDTLKQNILFRLKEDGLPVSPVSKTFVISSTAKKILSVAAILALIMLIIPFWSKHDGFMNDTAKAANSLLINSIDATGHVKNMVIKLRVRTHARDNFSLVGTEYGLVEHTISKIFGEPQKWRIDKGSRMVVFDGKYQYQWIPELEVAIKSDKNADFINWFKILLDPESILLKERVSTSDKDSKYSIEEKNGELCLKVTSKARGNFMNDYCKNRSIVQSDNRREYTFDSKTKLLKGLKIYVFEGSKETLVLETEEIDYNISIDPKLFSITLPEGAEWEKLANDVKNETFSNISSKRAAELIFDAMSKNKWDSIKDLWQFTNPVTIGYFKKEYGGLKIIKIGEPFKSGLYRGEFVPYEIKTLNGHVKKHNLALRNDNKNKVWMIDGGI